MKIPVNEQDLRIRASQSALASARLDGHEPSQALHKLLASWAEGSASLDMIRKSLVELHKEKP
jgi:hypothetical protein